MASGQGVVDGLIGPRADDVVVLLHKDVQDPYRLIDSLAGTVDDFREAAALLTLQVQFGKAQIEGFLIFFHSYSLKPFFSHALYKTMPTDMDRFSDSVSGRMGMVSTSSQQSRKGPGRPLPSLPKARMTG